MLERSQEIPAARHESPEPASLVMQWDEFCDLLGGATWEQAWRQWQLVGLSPERERHLRSVAPLFTSSSQFLFHNNGSCHPLEALWLKWNLFTTLCRKLLVLHNAQSPHLGLDPSRVLINRATSLHWLPARWLFSVDLLEPLGASPFRHDEMPEGMAESLFAPPPIRDPLYVSPALRDWPLGRHIPVTALIQSLDRLHEESDEVIRGLLRVHVISDVIDGTDCSDRDVFQLTLPLSTGRVGSIRLWARKVDVMERGIVVSGVTDPLSPSAWTHLQEAGQHVFSQAGSTVFRAFHLPCDIYSLGMLLFRALLVNQAHTPMQVEQALARIVRALEPVVSGIDPDDRATLHRRLSARFKEEGRIFSSSSVMFEHGADWSAAPTVPDELWYDALIVALRLVTRISGFSICQSRSGLAGHGRLDIEQVIQEAEQFGQRIRIELFESDQRNRTIRQACNTVRVELTAIGNR